MHRPRHLQPRMGRRAPPRPACPPTRCAFVPALYIPPFPTFRQTCHVKVHSVLSEAGMSPEEIAVAIEAHTEAQARAADRPIQLQATDAAPCALPLLAPPSPDVVHSSNIIEPPVGSASVPTDQTSPMDVLEFVAFETAIDGRRGKSDKAGIEAKVTIATITPVPAPAVATAAAATTSATKEPTRGKVGHVEMQRADWESEQEKTQSYQLYQTPPGARIQGRTVMTHPVGRARSPSPAGSIGSSNGSISSTKGRVGSTDSLQQPGSVPLSTPSPRPFLYDYDRWTTTSTDDSSKHNT